ncbi:MAG: hypothetical protein ACRYHQ_37340, partial [Janthinobacterium lividum]
MIWFRTRRHAGRVLGSVSARLVILAGIAGVPVVAMATMVVWQNYRYAADMAPKQVSLLRAEALAQSDAIVTDGLATLQSAAAALEGPGSDCGATLERVLATHAEEFTGLALHAPGMAGCSASSGRDLLPSPETYVLRPAGDPTMLVISTPLGRETIVGGIARSRFEHGKWLVSGISGPVWLDDGHRLAAITRHTL